jgi:HPt (histidine-containing phosphotransfer) domain-containing protein
MNDPVDLNRIQETAGGDREFEDELFNLFLSDCDDRIEKLEAAVKARDSEASCREAHSLKGAGGNIGTTQFQDVALRLEKTDPAVDAEKAETLLKELKEELERVRGFIQQYLAS